ncbi:MAG: DNA recombination protein RmuC [Rhodospirillales bacterium]|nr:DNA recombination protein RmuC [Rhodospirillales bacterium]
MSKETYLYLINGRNTYMEIYNFLFLLVLVTLCVIIFLLFKVYQNRTNLDQLITKFSENYQTQLQDQLKSQISAQAEIKGRMEQGQTNLNERLESLTKRISDGLNQQTEKTGVTLKQLNERLAVIDVAQKNITGLSEQMVGLQDILSNKQARGAFGEIQLNDLVTSILPPSAYAFQVTMSNGKRADCILNLPNPPGPIVIDAKFPLEAYHLLRNAKTEADQKIALRSLGNSILKHIQDISEKYIIPGETAESALMFLPSEAIYAELHSSLPNIVDKSYRSKVWIVAPTTLMATLNTVRAVLKDVHMREQASVIQNEVHIMLEDVKRLDSRVAKLQTHMRQADDDLRQISTSTEKVSKRGDRITEIELGEETDIQDLTATAKPELSK